MKKIYTWCKIFTKRELKRPSMIFILICMIAMSVALRYMSTDVTAAISVGFITDDIQIKENLLAHEGLVSYTFYDSQNELIHDVTAGSLQCGYVFDEGFREAVLSKNYRNLIHIYEAPENITSLLSNVVILSTVIEEVASDMLILDVKAQDFFDNISEEDATNINKLYELYSSNGSTFSFDYNALYKEYTGSSRNINIFDYLVTPVRGIVAIFIFIIALTGGLSWYKDKSSSTYANIPIKRLPWLKLLTISIPTILATFVGYVSLILAGISTNPFYDLLKIILYSMLCILFTCILTVILKQQVYCGLIPVFILGSVLCCPIFFKLSSFIKAMKILEFFFLPTYFI